MPASTARKAFGTLLKKGGTTVAEIRDINPTLTVNEEEVTHQEGVDVHSEWIPTTIDGEVSCTAAFVEGHEAVLLDEMSAGTVSTWTIVWPFGTPKTWSFLGFIKSLTPSGPVKGALGMDLTLRITGTIDYSAA